MRAFNIKKVNAFLFELEAAYKKGDVFKYPKVFQCNNEPEFKSDVAKLLEKHDVDTGRATTKYKRTYKSFVNNVLKRLGQTGALVNGFSKQHCKQDEQHKIINN